MFFLRSMVAKFVFWSLVLLVLVIITGVMAIRNNQNANGTPDYDYWQGKYKDIAADLADDPTIKQAARDTPTEVKQVTVIQFPLLKQDGTTQLRVDRCQSCHIGLGNPQMTAENIIKDLDGKTIAAADVPNYLKDPAHEATRLAVLTLGAHPGIDIESGATQHDLGVVHSKWFPYGIATNSSPTPQDKADYEAQKLNLKQHPFPTFGCTVCHYGSGRELIQNKAHGDPEHWLQPLLPAKYMEAACAQCHAQYNNKTFAFEYLPQLTTIARGEQLFKQQACYGCHKIEGFSKGNIGPELTYEGRTTVLSIEHQIWDPRYKVGTCVMPYFFAYRLHNTDDPDLSHRDDVVDPRAVTAQKSNDIATLDEPGEEDIAASLEQHNYVPLKSRQADVDALVTFIASQTGQNYASSQSDRFTAVSNYNLSAPPEVPVTVQEGKMLFETSGCYACHYIGDPNHPHVTGDPQFAKGGYRDQNGNLIGGVAGPELSWEGTRHSQEWLIEHYRNPQEFVPGSIMPIFPFSDSQRAALSLWDSAQKPDNPGARPVSADQDMPTPDQQKQKVQTRDIRYMPR